MKAKRSKSNLVPPIQLAPKIMDADARRYFLGMIALWRCFDLYFFGLQEMS